jgi:catalase (peroxidase I)
MGVFVRLAFHDAGTYDRFNGTSGANASLIYEMDHPHSAGLHWALKQIIDIKNHGNHITNMLSIADLI